MRGSFLKQGSGLQTPTELRNLLGGECPRGKLFERAEGNAVGLAQGAIDGAGFGHAHLGMVENQGRDIARVSVAVAHEASAFGRFENCRLEHPKVLFGATEREDWLSPYPLTVLFFGKAQQVAMGTYGASGCALPDSCAPERLFGPGCNVWRAGCWVSCRVSILRLFYSLLRQ